MLRVVAPAALLLVCLPASAGIIIGNPPQATWLLQAEADGVTRSLAAPVGVVELFGCDAADHAFVDVDRTVDLVEGWEPTLPDGSWCALTVYLDGPLSRCTDAGCVSTSPAWIDLDPEGTVDPEAPVLRGIIVGNPPLYATPG